MQQTSQIQSSIALCRKFLYRSAKSAEETSHAQKEITYLNDPTNQLPSHSTAILSRRGLEPKDALVDKS